MTTKRATKPIVPIRRAEGAKLVFPPLTQTDAERTAGLSFLDAVAEGRIVDADTGEPLTKITSAFLECRAAEAEAKAAEARNKVAASAVKASYTAFEAANAARKSAEADFEAADATAQAAHAAFDVAAAAARAAHAAFMTAAAAHEADSDARAAAFEEEKAAQIKLAESRTKSFEAFDEAFGPRAGEN